VTPSVPVQAAGVIYLVGVLATSSLVGARAGITTSALSALAFNYFFLPPRHTLVIQSNGDWLALGVFFVTALVTSQLASRVRRSAEDAARLAREAQLGERFSSLLVAGSDLRQAVPQLAREAALALGADDATITLDHRPPAEGGAGVVQLERDGCPVGWLTVTAIDSTTLAHDPATQRIARTLGSLIWLGQQRDRLVTERVETEALRRSDALKTALLRAVSHDLRSPLVAITTAAGALRLPSISADERRELADSIAAQSARLDRVIRNLLDLSRLQAGAAAPSPDWCSVEDLLTTPIRDVVREQPDAQIEVAIAAALPLVRIDSAQIERVVSNLVENAVKFSPPKTPVQVTAYTADGHVVISVADNGPGIPPADLARVFDPFFRVRPDSGPGGSGLGLAIARGLAEANGAEITVESTPGSGTVFQLVLPTAPDAAAIPA
jgi:two-component system, OmpR family, sensor histidine kinase KdpD